MTRRVATADLVPAASAVLLVTNAHQHLPLLVIGVAFLACAYLQPARLRRPAWWLGVAIASLAVDATRPLQLDDHIVLTHYWALALGLSLLAEEPARSRERNAHLLIGLTMAFAVTSKVAWGEFADGGFFQATILADDRFTWVAQLAGVTDRAANYASFDALARGLGPVPLTTGSLVGPITVALTIGTFLLEGGLALAYLAPGRAAWLLRVRTWLLVAFCLATYAIVPVAGFGSILLVMASADRRLGRTAQLRRLGLAAGLYAWGLLWQALH